ncbi:GTP-binding protein ypt4 [Massarina eburnea CBS 473.64]|uniref:GTP-binding protein ypt4 n=1 Tax=Massarina eburnea CBS 473.64 TaxID=1395130 RepID=A0A6A6RTJ1_9PLEO|nr:GTP-binding protein ypt4 [Massarina eburnea CBS 473.64]
MGRPRKESNASSRSGEQPARELGNMYDYLAKVILLGPSSAGKSCILHRFINSSWKILSSQTIGVEFASKIVHITPRSSSPHSSAPGTRKRIKLQLWDTAGTERFRSVSRSYYRGAAGAILVYDVCNWRSFDGLRTFLDDARALASPNLTVIVAGNKADAADGADRGSGGGEGGYGSWGSGSEDGAYPSTPGSQSSRTTSGSMYGTAALGLTKATVAPEGREVPFDTASRWAGQNGIPVAVEVSALTGENVDELFERLARMILTKIELGEIDPDDPNSGIQYGDMGGWGRDDNVSISSGITGEGIRQRRGKAKGTQRREWEEVFRLSGSTSRRRGCC